jgi:hypothetical protein
VRAEKSWVHHPPKLGVAEGRSLLGLVFAFLFGKRSCCFLFCFGNLGRVLTSCTLPRLLQPRVERRRQQTHIQNTMSTHNDVNLPTGTNTASTSTSTSSPLTSSAPAGPLQTFLEDNPFVLELEVLPRLSPTDRGLFARAARTCHTAVAGGCTRKLNPVAP